MEKKNWGFCIIVRQWRIAVLCQCAASQACAAEESCDLSVLRQKFTWDMNFVIPVVCISVRMWRHSSVQNSNQEEKKSVPAPYVDEVILWYSIGRSVRNTRLYLLLTICDQKKGFQDSVRSRTTPRLITFSAKGTRTPEHRATPGRFNLLIWCTLRSVVKI